MVKVISDRAQASLHFSFFLSSSSHRISSSLRWRPSLRKWMRFWKLFHSRREPTDVLQFSSARPTWTNTPCCHSLLFPPLVFSFSYVSSSLLSTVIFISSHCITSSCPSSSNLCHCLLFSALSFTSSLLLFHVLAPLALSTYHHVLCSPPSDPLHVVCPHFISTSPHVSFASAPSSFLLSEHWTSPVHR